MKITIAHHASSVVGLVLRTVYCGTVQNPLFWEGGFWKKVLSNIKPAEGVEARDTSNVASRLFTIATGWRGKSAVFRRESSQEDDTKAHH